MKGLRVLALALMLSSALAISSASAAVINVAHGVELDYNVNDCTVYGVFNKGGNVDTDTEHGYVGRLYYSGCLDWSRTAILIDTSSISGTVTSARLYFKTYDFDTHYPPFTEGFSIYVFTKPSFNLDTAYCTANATSKRRCWDETQSGYMVGSVVTTQDQDNYSIDITGYLNDDRTDGTMRVWFRSNREDSQQSDDAQSVVIDTPYGYKPYVEYSTSQAVSAPPVPDVLASLSSVLAAVGGNMRNWICTAFHVWC